MAFFLVENVFFWLKMFFLGLKMIMMTNMLLLAVKQNGRVPNSPFCERVKTSLGSRGQSGVQHVKEP